MKINTLHIIIIALIVVNIFLLYRLFNRDNDKPKDNYANVKVERLIEISRIADEINMINKDCVLIDKDSHEVFISDLLTTNPLLILKISKLNCNTCTNQDVEILERFLNKYTIKEGKIVILYQDSNIRDVTLLSRSLNNRVPIYRIKEKDSLQLQIDELNIPYFFVLDSSFAPKLIHVTNKLFPDFTNEYLEIVYNKILNEDM